MKDLRKQDKGSLSLPKRMNFRKSSEGGVISNPSSEGGSFPIQKSMLQIFAIIRGTSVMNFGKNLQHDFPKMRGGVKAVRSFSENSSVLVCKFVP